jgi:hypothetical protein
MDCLTASAKRLTPNTSVLSLLRRMTFHPRVVRLVLSMGKNVKQSDEPFHLSQVPGVRVVSSGLTDYSITLVQVASAYISHKLLRCLPTVR